MTTPAITKRVPPTAMLNRRASFAYLNGIAIVISNVDKWTDEEVLAMLNEQKQLAGSISAIANVTHFFGEVFGARHRKMAVDWIESNGLKPSARTAMVTDSAFMRAALTAYSWLSKSEVKAFEPKDKAAMCKWICEGTGVAPDDVQSALETCYRLINK